MSELTFKIAGVKFHEYKKVIDKISENDILKLEPEPTNPYDPNAVKILYQNTMLGYVPKKFSSEVSASIEAFGPDKVKCILTKFEKGAKTYEMFEVTIKEEEE